MKKNPGTGPARAKSGESRRGVLKKIAAVGMIAAMGKGAQGATTTSSPATTQADDLSVSDLASTDKVLGHPYSREEQKLALSGVRGKRGLMLSFRKRDVEDLEPAVQFNPRVAGTVIPRGESKFLMCEGNIPNYDGNAESLAFASAADLSRLIHARKVTSLELTKMYLNRLKTIGRKLNAVITMTEERALAAAKRADEELAAGKDRGPLHGIPYGAKDCFAAKGYPTTWGVEVFKDREFNHDATVIAKLDDAGAVLCAKLSLGELCMGDVWFGGMTRTPWAPKEGSSGSSAGPCAMVAAGCVGFAIGTETHGSIISPCMVNGTTGLRPTYGRVSRFGAMALSRSMDKIGTIGRSVEDCAMVLSAIHGADDKDPTATDVPFVWDQSVDVKKLRVGYDPAGFKWDSDWYKKNPGLSDVHRAAFEKVKGMVGELVPIKLPGPEFGGVISMTIASESSSSFLPMLMNGDVRKLKQQGKGAWPNAFRIGSEIPAADYLRAMQIRSQLMRAMHESMKDVDCYITLPYAGVTVEYTNVTGHPSLVLRDGMWKGRPKLMEIVGKLYREDVILALGLEVEKAMGVSGVWPDTSTLGMSF
jgi:Asp-tRNA(Asn)/Glu-tRNA(Gln) amidotransferase A subunit family amidase